MREWWAEKVADDGVDRSLLTWSGLLENWDAVETDFHHFFGIDFGDGILTARRWRWFRIRLVRLLAEETALARALGVRDTDNSSKTFKKGDISK